MLARKRQVFHAMLAGLVVLGCSLARAQVVPPVPAAPHCKLPVESDVSALDPAQAQAMVAEQLTRLPECQRDAAWLAWVGQALNHLRRYALASEYLERALMLEPEPPAVRAAYAIALAGNGDQLAALSLLQSLHDEPGLPPTLQRAVQRQLAQWTEQPSRGPVQRVYVGLRLGYDSNLLGTPNLASLTLTLPGQSLQLPLDASYLSRPGYSRRIDGGWTLQHGAWQLAASVGGRDSPQEPDAALQQLQVSAERLGAKHYLNASAGWLRSQGGARYRTLGLSGGARRNGAATSGCQDRIGPEWQQRRLASNPVLSGDFLGIVWQRSCEAQHANANQRIGAWQISLRAGQDRPQDPARPGAVQNQAGIRLVALGAGWAPGQEWLLDGELFHQQDTAGYSPLLKDNARRRLTRAALRAEYTFALSPPPIWSLSLGLEWQNQQSNLLLFQQKSHGAYLALRRQW